MKLGLLFAGQGSQHAGMGLDLYEKSERFRRIFDLLPEEKRKIAFQGPAEAINDTRNTQPIMVAFAAGVLAELMPELEKKGISISAAAGLSLGEYSALHGAGVFDAETAIRLVTARANAMYEASKNIECGMKAILGMDIDAIRKCCETANNQLGEGKQAQISNLNCPGQIVIGGEKEAVELAGQLALEDGAKRAVPLAVSGPFHTSYMLPAGRVLEEVFSKTEFKPMNMPVIFNAVGKTLDPERHTIADMLIKQVSSPVHFEESIREMEAMGIDTVIEIGPGKALSGFVRKTCRTITCISVETYDDIENALGKL